MSNKSKTKRKREPERIQKGSNIAKRIFGLIGIESARDKRLREENTCENE